MSRADLQVGRSVVLDAADWQAGFDAGEAGQPMNPTPPGRDGLSWASGWIEGQAKRQSAGCGQGAGQ